MVGRLEDRADEESRGLGWAGPGNASLVRPMRFSEATRRLKSLSLHSDYLTSINARWAMWGDIIYTGLFLRGADAGLYAIHPR